jgi:glycosyltransferase involved in cell wall biosynthesis
MVNTPSAPQFTGGDLIQMRRTADRLRALGVEVSESFEAEPDASGFDLAHVFNLRTIDVTAGQVDLLKANGLPVVMTPIYLNPSFAFWGTRTISEIFSSTNLTRELKGLLAQLASRELRVKLAAGGELSAASELRPQADYDGQQRAILEKVDRLLPNSLLEMSSLMTTLRVSDLPFTVVPYAVDPGTFLDPDPSSFVERYGVSDFVLQVGRIEPSKNQLLLAWALRETDLRLVLIGGNLQPRYLEWCREHGPDGLVVIPHMPQDELGSAYAAARVHALPSWIETCGMATMEAVLADCGVVVSTAGYEIEYYAEHPRYCDPADTESIAAAVIAAYEAHSAELERRGALRERVLREYTWERAAELTLAAYREVLEAA